MVYQRPNRPSNLPRIQKDPLRWSHFLWGGLWVVVWHITHEINGLVPKPACKHGIICRSGFLRRDWGHSLASEPRLEEYALADGGALVPAEQVKHRKGPPREAPRLARNKKLAPHLFLQERAGNAGHGYAAMHRKATDAWGRK